MGSPVDRPELPLFTHWEGALKDILSRTEKFPKKVRFTLSGRMDNLALDFLERLVEARYTKDKTGVLEEASLVLEKLRVLARISHDCGHLDHKGYEYVARNVDEAGRMLGGWLRSRAGR